MAARIAMAPTTIINSINVKPPVERDRWTAARVRGDFFVKGRLSGRMASAHAAQQLQTVVRECLQSCLFAKPLICLRLPLVGWGRLHNPGMSLNAGSSEAAAVTPKAAEAVRAGFVALPFLFPIVAGPSVNVWQLLASWACLATWLFIGPVGALARGVCVWLVVGAAAVALAGKGGAASWLPACVALAGMAAAASLGVGSVRDRAGSPRPLAVGLLVAGLASAVFGLLQYFRLAEPLAPWVAASQLGQAYGNLRQRNQFATLINMALVAAFWLHATHASRRLRRWLAAAAVLLLLAAAASTSRTGLLQLMLIIMAVSYMARRKRCNPTRSASVGYPLPPPVALLAMIPLHFAFAWLLPQLAGSGVEGMLHRLHAGAPDDHSRLILWHNVLSLIAERPWTGWGWGELSFAHYTTLYPGPRFIEILDNAHNLPLHLAVELGIPAAVLVCGGFIWLVITAKPWRERDPARLMAWGMLAMIVLHSLLEYPLWYGPFQLVFGLCLGMLWPARSDVRFRAPALSAFAASALMVVVVYTGWDYLRVSQIYLPRSERLPAYEDDTLAKLRGSWLFARQVDFAEVTLTTVTPANAARMHELAERTLHFSPEPRVIIKLIESAELLGREDEVRAQVERFRIAFPLEFNRWLEDPSGDAPAP
jgi:O-antigen ligase